MFWSIPILTVFALLVHFYVENGGMIQSITMNHHIPPFPTFGTIASYDILVRLDQTPLLNHHCWINPMKILLISANDFRFWAIVTCFCQILLMLSNASKLWATVTCFLSSGQTFSNMVVPSRGLSGSFSNCLVAAWCWPLTIFDSPVYAEDYYYV